MDSLRLSASSRELPERVAFAQLTLWPPIKHLFSSGRPTAIPRLVIAIIVDAIKRSAGRRISHIGIKIRKGPHPAFTNRDSSSPVPFPIWASRVIAAFLHPTPGGVNQSPREAMAELSGCGPLFLEASARKRCSATKARNGDALFSTAIAMAKPIGALLCAALNRLSFQKNKAAYALAGVIFVSWHFAILSPAIALDQISPVAKLQFFDNSGHLLSGGKLFTYAAGSSTKTNTFTDAGGLTANANPIILNTRGESPSGVWLTPGQSYKFVLSPSTDTDPPTNAFWTVDNITGALTTATNGTVTSLTGACLITVIPDPITTTGQIDISAIGDQTLIGNISGGSACPTAIPVKTIAGLSTFQGKLFTTTGTFTLASTSLKATVVGAGGGGGGGGSGGQYGGSSGGGAGACIAYISGLTIGNTLTVTIAAAGTGGATTVAGTTGGNTVLSSGTQVILTRTATGGGGGGPGTASAGAVGTGGTPTCQTGDFAIAGPDGILGQANGAGAPQIPNGIIGSCGSGGHGGTVSGSGGNSGTGCVILEWVAPP